MARPATTRPDPPSSDQLGRADAEQDLESLADEAAPADADALSGWEKIEVVSTPRDPLILGAEAEVDLGYLALQLGFRLSGDAACAAR